MNAILLLIAALITPPQSPLAKVEPVKAYLVYERFGSFLANELDNRINAYAFDDMPPKSMIISAWSERRGEKHLIYARLVRYRGPAPERQRLTGMYPEDLVYSRVEYSDGTFIEKGKR